MKLFQYLSYVVMAGAVLSCTNGNVLKADANAPNDPVSTAIHIYRDPLNHLSAVRRGECPMHPSCSEYSHQSIKKYGLFKGWIMTCDRLMRCGRDELKSAPRVLVNGKWKYYDPVEHNDFSQQN
jgi:putative component of membrane protein insertase Oxa1/YidC/SpoIIIJ protein YidD